MIGGIPALPLPGRNFLKQFRQGPGVIHGLTEAGRFIGPSKPSNLTLQNRLLDGGHEIMWRLGWSLSPAVSRQTAQHPVVPESGGFTRRAIRVRSEPALCKRTQNRAHID